MKYRYFDNNTLENPLFISVKDNQGVEEAFFYLANEYHKLHAEQANTMAHIA